MLQLMIISKSNFLRYCFSIWHWPIRCLVHILA